MNIRKRLLRIAIAVLGVLMTSGVGAVGRADGDGPGAILGALKAKDNAFDNAVLRYTTWWEEVVGPWPYWRRPPRTPEEEQDAKDNRPGIVKFRYHNELVVRGPDSTLTSEIDPELKQGEESRGWNPGAYLKISQMGNVVGMITDTKDPSGLQRLFEIREKGGAVDIPDEKRTAVAFVHGFGFGTRIKTIDSVVREGDRRILTGTIQIWWEDVSTFRIELSDDFLVKRARVDCDTRGHWTRFEVTSEGAIARQGYVFARTGHFQRLNMGWKDAEETASKPRVTEEFSARFDDVRFHLSEEEYTTLTRMELTPGTDVRDSITNTRYRVGKDNTIENRRVLYPNPP